MLTEFFTGKPLGKTKQRITLKMDLMKIYCNNQKKRELVSGSCFGTRSVKLQAQFSTY
jgi:hypothetical protein